MSRFTKLEILALVAVTLVGLVYVPHPFRDDQAFFTIGAWKMSQGAMLYRDYWDIKQPGIFLFYLAGGKLFGFDEIGVHGFELLYMVAFGVVLMITLRDYFEQRWGPALMVLLTIGFYFGVSALPHLTLDYLTQVEGLVGFPMFLCAWYACRAAERKGSRARNLFLSGIMAGLVLLLKLMFLPMVVSFWIASFVYGIRGRRGIVADGLRFAIPIVLGVALPILLVVAYFAERGGFSYLWYASFVWPVRAIGKLPLAGPGRLHEGLQFLVDGFAPLMALGFLGAWGSLRRRWDILTINLLLWLATGMFAILIQLRSWWPHHYLLLSVPLGILATKGVEFLCDQMRAPGASSLTLSRRIPLMVALFLLFTPVIYPTAADALLEARYRFTIGKRHLLAYQCRFPNNQYLTSDELGFLTQPDSLPGPIYVAGTSMYYYLSGRLPAVPMCADPADFLPDQWLSFAKAISEARPPYVFVSFPHQDLFAAKSPATSRWISENYRVLRKDKTGIWYVLASAPENHERLDGQLSFRTPSPGCPAREETRAQ